MEYITNSSEETKKIAADFVKTIKGGEVFFLKGDLGAGKTVFVQGLANALGVDEPVRSPTYALVKIYPTNHAAIKYLVHADLYRLDEQVTIESIGLDEWLERKDAVVIVEWGEKMRGILSNCSIELKSLKANQRIIIIDI